MTGSYRASIGHNPLIRVKRANPSFTGGPVALTIAAGLPLPSQPTWVGAGATAVSSSQINLAWNAAANATSYTIRRDAVVIVSGITSLTYQDATLSSSTQYGYTVQGVNATGAGTQSAVASATTQAGANPTWAFNNGFENYATGFTFNGPDPALYGYSVNGAGLIQVVNSHAREGTKSLRMAITASAAGNYRQELRTKDSLEGDPINSISDYWLGLSIYVPTTAATNAISVAFQWHTTDNPQVGHSPSIGIRLGPNGWRMTRELDDNATMVGPSTIELGQVVKNQWTDFVMHVIHRTTPTGLIQLWMNEDVNPRVDYSNLQTIATADAQHPAQQTVVPYFKFGIYGSQGNFTTERLYDAVRISTNGDRNSMKPVGDRLAAT